MSITYGIAREQEDIDREKKNREREMKKEADSVRSTLTNEKFATIQKYSLVVIFSSFN